MLISVFRNAAGDEIHTIEDRSHYFVPMDKLPTVYRALDILDEQIMKGITPLPVKNEWVTINVKHSYGEDIVKKCQLRQAVLDRHGYTL